MRRLPRLRSPVPAGLIAPSPSPASPFRAPATTIISSCSRHSNNNNSTTPRAAASSPARPLQPRYLSTTTPIRRASSAPSPAELEDEFPAAPELTTSLPYPGALTTAPPAAQVDDPTYTPAQTADGLEEVGGLADWWDRPGHWDSEALLAAAATFGPIPPARRVSDPALLQVLARRAVVEALVAGRFAGAAGRKKVDRIFACVGASARWEEVAGARLGAAFGEWGWDVTLEEEGDWQRVWDMLSGMEEEVRKRKQRELTRAWLEEQKMKQRAAEEGVEEMGVAAAEAEAQDSASASVSETETPKLEDEIPLETARELVKSWGRDWWKAGLRDPVVKFYAAKRIQQLTGHRIPDGKLHTITTVGALIKQLIEPPKPKKLAELVESQKTFDGLSNVRVFPRRVTPIDKEKMVGRWKIIVRELEKRDLPVIGTGDYGPPIEKKWVEGKA